MQLVNKVWEAAGGRSNRQGEIEYRREKKGQRKTEEIEKATSISWIR